MRARIALTAATAALLAGTLTACDGIADLPLPGGAATGSDAYRVTVANNSDADHCEPTVEDKATGAFVHVTYLPG